MKPLSSFANHRRRLLLTGAGCWALHSVGAHAHANLGPVQPPVVAPSLRLTPSAGAAAPLPALLRGHITALQLMFTGCSAVCPIQGAMYADVQRQLDKATEAPDWRLLSVSIDALNDGPDQLRQWLGRYGAQPARWRAAVPSVADVDPLFDFLQGQAGGLDRHTAQVFVFDRQSRLAFRTVDLPSSTEVLSALRVVAARR